MKMGRSPGAWLHLHVRTFLSAQDSKKAGREGVHEVGAPSLNFSRSLQLALLLPVALIVALFFLWGVANNLNDVLIAHIKKLFTLSDLEAGLVQSAFYLGYFCLTIPAALFMRVRGYRAAVLAGLILYAGGALLFLPAAAAQSYPFFLAALFVIAAGLAFLETSANPLIARLGSEASASRRLNLAWAFNPLGSMTGVVLGSKLILSGTEAPVGASLAAWRRGGDVGATPLIC
jgi:MFS transporter, FHS family, L-fucose permease